MMTKRMRVPSLTVCDAHFAQAMLSSSLLFNPFSATRHLKRHQNKVKVKGVGRNSSYLAGFSIFFHGSMKKFNQLSKKKLLKIFSSIKTKVAIKLRTFFFFFFLAKKWLGAEKVNEVLVKAHCRLFIEVILCWGL